MVFLNRVSAKIKKMMRAVLRSSDFPAECLNSTPVVEIKGTEEATVSGVVRILGYTLSEIVIDVCEFTVTINGKCLTLYSLDREKVCVSGAIQNVSLGERCVK